MPKKSIAKKKASKKPKTKKAAKKKAQVADYAVLASVEGHNDYESILVHGMTRHLGRPCCLPYVAEDDVGGPDDILRVPVPESLRRKKGLLGRGYGQATREEFEDVRREMAAHFRGVRRAAVVKARPGTDIGFLQLERIGDWVPDISFPGVDDVIVSARVLRALKRGAVRGFDSVPILPSRIVQVAWKPGDPVTKKVTLRGGPEQSILGRKHHPDLASKLASNLREFVAQPIDWRRAKMKTTQEFKCKLGANKWDFHWRPSDIRNLDVFSYLGIVILRRRVLSVFEPFLGVSARLVPLKRTR